MCWAIVCIAPATDNPEERRFPLDDKAIQSIVEEVLGKLHAQQTGIGTNPAADKPITSSNGARRPATRKGRANGVFPTADEACEAAQAGFEQLRDKGLDARRKVCEIIKKTCTANAEAWGKLEFEETRIGRLDHKIEKLQIIELVPGVEAIRPDAWSGDHGLTTEEFTPFGVVGAVTPVTHSVPTLAGNVVNIVAAGNAVVFNPHPAGAKCAVEAVRVFNEAIYRETGIENLVCVVEAPTLESFNELTQNEHVRIMCVTGGPGVVKAAMKSGKRSVCAGPGNPPVIVDQCADPDKAAADILRGGAYDNNLLCIGEKEVFVVDAIYDEFLRAFERQGGQKISGSELDRLTEAAFTFKEGEGVGCAHPVLKRDLVGKDPEDLAKACGATIKRGTQMLFAETEADHVFVIEEQMMPFIPIVRVRDIEEAIEASVVAEHGYKHSALIHSLNVDHITAAGRALDCTLFVKNGPCVAGLGLGGEGYLSYSIATTTGEGITTPLTFTRKRRCVMTDGLRIY